MGRMRRPLRETVAGVLFLASGEGIYSGAGVMMICSSPPLRGEACRFEGQQSGGGRRGDGVSAI